MAAVSRAFRSNSCLTGFRGLFKALEVFHYKTERFPNETFTVTFRHRHEETPIEKGRSCDWPFQSFIHLARVVPQPRAYCE